MVNAERVPEEDQAPRTAKGRPVRRWPVVAVSALVAFMAGLNISAMIIAVPLIDEVFDLTDGDQQWLVSGYFLTFGLALVPAGRYGDVRGRRNIFVVGAALFVVASVVAGSAPSGGVLIVARLVQGLAAGMTTPQVFGLIQRLFAPRDRGLPFGVVAAGVSLARLLGPLLGGGLIVAGGTEFGWRWVFLLNVPIGLTVAVAGWRLFPVAESAERPKMDVVAVLLLVTGLTSLWLIQGEGLSLLVRALLLLAGLAALVGFAVWERRYTRRGEPLFNLSLFGVRSFALGLFVATFYHAGYDALYYLFSEYLQDGLGHDELAAGVALTPLALGATVGSVVAGAKAGRIGRPLVAAGLLLAAVGITALTVVDIFLPGPGSPHTATLPLLLAGLGGGLAAAGVGGGMVVAPNQTLTLSEVPRAEAGSAGGMLQTGQRFGGGLGVAVVGAALFESLDRTGTWTLAFRLPLLIIICFLVIGLVAAVADLHHLRRHRTNA
ncbi:MFS transporter [Micromonospora sp. WMMA1363]|uniref:MFS transporter n=1 Tax=Micromonospora sp. WMMA1363 TaxID=3053985 RepID=UPI00259D13FA|nr:MFS transporter [Micromonospora sp. WMMA1363]MDM4718733.1 MFS transporter [Micromonospora sp. WMMA1363]